jgi:hypothetical protein
MCSTIARQAGRVNNQNIVKNAERRDALHPAAARVSRRVCATPLPLLSRLERRKGLRIVRPAQIDRLDPALLPT